VKNHSAHYLQKQNVLQDVAIQFASKHTIYSNVQRSFILEEVQHKYIQKRLVSHSILSWWHHYQLAVATTMDWYSLRQHSLAYPATHHTITNITRVKTHNHRGLYLHGHTHMQKCNLIEEQPVSVQTSNGVRITTPPITSTLKPPPAPSCIIILCLIGTWLKTST
jgi:hypothetical protein